ncbi:hypothetical protein [Dyadobacter sp. LHD-138]|uniref:hypothetical protein n=1 Tax=Dyadobacter sp. LHD-138 TaxID=3071413 RepID=UPI0027DF70B9|nr:hypothetical protein [Dyadobacter sp. LHD-138]MDQ6482650.1 hypothetical protein [Dyadobacter sp. LHD-138]
MKHVFDKLMYEDIKGEVNNIFNLNVEFPGQIFEKAQHFIFLEFDAFCLEKFYKSFVSIAGSSFFFTLDPNPENYYYYHFKKYNVFTFSEIDSFSDYITLLHMQPEKGAADAIADVVNCMVISSTKSIISVYGNRDLGCLIVGFMDQNSMKKFIAQYGENHIFSISDAIKGLFPSNYHYLDTVKLNYG